MAATRRLPLPARLALIALIGFLAAALLVATGFDLGLLMLMPAFLTLAILLAWPEPGLELILRIASRRRRPRSSRPRFAGRRRRGIVARGGRLLSASLGGRAPPRLVGCS